MRSSQKNTPRTRPKAPPKATLKAPPKSALPETPTVFRAFADETRLRILNVLREGELCVCDLCDVLQVTQPKVSRHLAYLRRAELVDVRSEGKWKYYSLPRHPAGLAKTLLGCVGSCLRDIEPLRSDRSRLKSTNSAAKCCTQNCREL